MNLPVLNGSNLLTNSRLQCWKRCPREHLFRYELGIRPVNESRALRMGSAVHEGLDARKKGRPIDESIGAALAAYGVMPEGYDADRWAVEAETVAQMLAGYFWRWEIDDLDPAITVAEVVKTEFAFDLPIFNPATGAATPTFRSAGKIDGIVRLGDGRLAVLEHKTTGDSLDPDSDYWRRLRIDEQISRYMLAARAMGFPVETVLYDVIRKPSIAPKQVPVLDDDGLKVVLDADGVRVYGKNGKPRQTGDADQGYTLQQNLETPEQFGERFRLDIGERPDFYYARREIPRLDADLEEFEAELWQAQQAVRETQKSGRWFRNTGACSVMGRCTYLDFCHQGFDPEAPLPAGLERVTELHPELVEGDPS